MDNHELYINRCLELAKNGLGNTYPNPLVGSVIVYNGRIIGEGYHTKAGTPHAEINAINSVKDKSLLKKSTIYVNLEPCSHYGKTPPCAEKIAELKIPNVVIGTLDTTDKVSGKGVKIMRDAGLNVTIGVLNETSRELNRRFFTFHEKKRPYIILKWAQTSDGYIDLKRNEESERKPNWITGETERILVHKWRTEEQSILVGTNTVEIDNPTLNSRDWEGHNPTRLVIDKKLRLIKNSNIFNNDSNTIIFNYSTDKKEDNVDYVKISQKKDFLHEVLSYLYAINIQSVIIEGGRELLQSFINENLWDEARVFIGNKMFFEGIKGPTFKSSDFVKKQSFNNSELFIYRNKQ